MATDPEYPFATLAELKERLRIPVTNDDDDAFLGTVLNNVSGSMETYVGRALRRRHVRTEYHPGSEQTIRLGMTNIAKVHSVRESETRDFDDSDNYEELVENTDWNFDDPGGAEPGASGELRRIAAKWSGSRTSPRQVQVRYTAGFKTSDEADLENTETTVTATSIEMEYALRHNLASDYYHLRRPSSSSQTIVIRYIDDDTEPFQGFIQFDTSRLIPRSAAVTRLRLFLWAQADQEGDFIVRAYILPQSIIDPTFATVFDLYGSSESESFEYDSYDESDPQEGVFHAGQSVETLASAQFLAAATKAIQAGRMPLSLFVVEDGDVSVLSSFWHEVDKRPRLEITHMNSFDDPFFVIPPALRNACAIQAVHEYQTRMDPGITSQSSRGVAIASGAAHAKEMIQLLPAVKGVLKTFQRLF